MTIKTARPIGEKHSRTVFKTISWRIVASLTTMTIVFIFTKEEMLALGVGIAEVITKVIFYYLHERVWNKIGWGKKKHPLADIPVTRELDPGDREKIESQLKELGYMD